MSFKKSAAIAAFILAYTLSFSQDNSVGINTNSPNANAVLELVSPNSNQGFLVPRLSTAQRTSMTLNNSDDGLMVFDLDLDLFFFWNNGSWKAGLGVINVTTAGGDLTGSYPNPVIRTAAVIEPKIADEAVSTSKLQNSSITTEKIDNSAVTTQKIADLAITSNKLENVSSISAGTYGTEAFNVLQLAIDQKGRVTGVSEVVIQIGSAHIINGSIQNADIANGTITISKINPQGNTDVVLTVNSSGGIQWTDRSEFASSALSFNNIFIGNSSGVTQGLPVSGDISLTNTGTAADAQIEPGVIVNADINTSAAINAIKLADGSVSNTEFQNINNLNQRVATTDNVTFNNVQVDGDITLATGASVNEFSTDGTLTDDSDNAVPTEQAVKTYVDTQVGNQDLQEAYIDGNIITTSSAEGDVIIQGTEKLRVTADGGIQVANDTDLNGTLDAAGQTDLAASGVATNVRGTLGVAEQATFTGNVDANSGVDVTGLLQADDDVTLGADNTDALIVNANADFNDVVNIDGNLDANNGVDITSGNLNVTDNATITGNTRVDGTFQFDAAGQTVDNIVTTIGATGLDTNVPTEQAVREAISGSVTADNGVNENPDGNIQLGGDLIIPTTIGVTTGNSLTLTDGAAANALVIDDAGTITTGTGQVTLGGNVDANNGVDVANADLTVGGTNFIVDDATGNTDVAGTLDVAGQTDLAASGVATNVRGTLGVAEQATFTGNVDANSGVDVTGLLQADDDVTLGADNTDALIVNANADFNDVVNIDGNLDANNGVDITSGNLNVTDNATITGNTRVDGTFQFDAAGQTVDNIVTTIGATGLDTNVPTEQAVREAISGSVTADNGVNENPDGNIQLGGDLIIPTTIGVTTGNSLTLTDGAAANALVIDDAGTITTGTGQVTLGGNVDANNGVDVANADLTVGGTNFIVDDATGNTDVAGTLDVAGQTDLAASGVATNVRGTLGVAEQATFTGNVDANSGVDVTGLLQADDDVTLGADNTDALIVNANADFNDVVNIDGNLDANNGVDITSGNLNVTDNATITGNTRVDGTFQFDAAGQTVDNIVTTIGATGLDTNVPTEQAVREAISGSVTADNGVNENPDGNIQLGGDLIIPTDIGVEAGTTLTISDAAEAAALSINETGDITAGNGTITAGTGQVTLGGNVDANNGVDVANADLTVGGTNFIVDDATGNTDVAGTLDVAGQTDLAASGVATNVRGTLGVAEQATFTGNVDANSGVDVTGLLQADDDVTLGADNTDALIVNANADFNDVVNIDGNLDANNGVDITSGNLNVTDNATITGNTRVDGTFQFDAAGQTVDNIVTTIGATGLDTNVPTEQAVREAISGSVTADNGVNENPDGNIQLGGDLIIPTDIGVEAGTTLTISDAAEAAALSINETGDITAGNGTITAGTGQVTLGGNVDANNGVDVANADLTVGGTNFIVDDATGNTDVAGTLDVAGQTDLAASGVATNVRGTLGVAEQATFTGNVDANSGVDVTGLLQADDDVTLGADNTDALIVNANADFNDVVNIDGNLDANNGVDITSGNLNVTDNATITGNTRVDGTFQFDAAGQTVDNIVTTIGATGLDTNVPTEQAVREAISGSVTADNGVNENPDGNIQLGGDLIIPTTIGVTTGNSLTLTDGAAANALVIDDAGTITTGTGQVTLGGNVDANNGVDVANADLTVGGTNFIVDDATGNTDVAGTLDVAGQTDLAASGVATNVRGTLGVAEQATFTGNVDANSGVDVTGLLQADDDVTLGADNTDALIVNANADFNDVVNIDGNLDANNGVDITSGNLNVTDNATITGNTRVDGTFQFDAAGQTVDNIVTTIGATGLDTNVPTEQAVREAISGSVTADNGVNENPDGNIQLGGDLIIPTDIGVEAGTTLTISDAAEAAALSINETGDITAGNGTITAGTGQVTLGGNVDANNGVDVANADLTVGGTNFIVDDATGNTDVAGTLDVAGQTDLAASGVAINVRGTLGVAEQATFTGNIDANSGVDVANADLTVGGTNFTVDDATGDVTTAGNATITGNTRIDGTFQFDAAGQTVDNIVTTIGATGLDTNVPTEQAVREAISGSVTADNGVNENPDGNIQLGGDLIIPTTIGVTTGNSLTLTDGAAANALVIDDAGTITTGTGQVTLGGNVDANNGVDVANADLTVGGTNFIVDDATGNTDVAGTLDVAGQTDLAASGVATNVRGTLGVAEQATFTGNVDANSGVDVTGLLQADDDVTLGADNTDALIVNANADFNDVVNIDGNLDANNGVDITSGNLNVTDNATITGNTRVDGTFQFDAAGQTVDNIVTTIGATGLDTNVPTEQAVREAISGSVTADNGVNENPDGNIQLGGDLIIPTDIGVEAGTTLTISDAAEAAALSINETGDITAGNGTITAGTGQVTLGGNVDANNGVDVANADLTVGGTNFIVDDATGNTDVAGTLDVAGQTDLAASGVATNVRGTLGVAEQATFTGNVDANSGVDVTGLLQADDDVTLGADNTDALIVNANADFNDVVNIDGNLDANNGVDITSGNLNVTDNATITGNTRVDGTFQFDAAGQTVDNIVTTIGATGLDTNVPTEQAVREAIDASNSLADGNIFVGSAGGVATAQSLGGDASIINDGTLTVNSVGGSTAANIAAAEAIANAATDANTASAVVRRDASGNFSAGTISADLTGNVTGNVSGTAANVTGIVAGDNGGTGVDNGANTITIGGNVNTADAFSTAGANPLTLTTTATTNVTLPATGTLATLTGTETLTNKTLTDADANTQTAGDNSTKVATTAYVDGAVTSSNSLADGNIFVGSAGGVATAQSLGGDASIINDGTLTVNSVGGSTAANIAAAEAIANAATDANTASAVVRRDASGNFSAGTISADLTGNVTGNVSGTAANVTGIVAGDNGGTGVDNGANTITIGGNVNTADAFSTAGANPLTLTTTATTNVTLPATGTLATLTGTETLTNKTLTDADANTQTAGDNSTKVATTAYVDGAVTSSNSLADGNIFVGSAGGVATAQSLGGDASIINDGTLTVNSVGGSTAANIAAAEAIANAATDANTASAVVRRDASGNFSAGTISADLTGNVTGNVSGTAANVTGIVAGDNGGTGVDNGANTITIGGNVNTADAFSTAGANPLTLTTTATTNVTLPATGTLATLTGTETLTNKTLTDADANTQTAGDNSTKVATTAYVDGAVTSSNSLADGNIFVGSAGGVATAQSLGGDASIINDGTLTVNSVGGSTAANIAAAEAIANAATDANTASAVVRRDASGNFSAGTISADLTGNVTGNVSGTAANVTGIVAGDNGGTGVDNGANTITIGGNVNTADAFSTAGANPLTLTTTATTNVTLPATGTLATLTGTETLTNKTLTDADANTQTAGDNSTKVATTAYVDGAVTSSNSLADGNIFVGSAGGVATAQSLGGDASIINDGTLTVNSVGGSTAANIAAAEAIANAATDANTASAVVRRDASGNFSAGTISADLTGNVTGNVSGTAANVTGIVAGDNGGTGVDNGANTITIGGNVNTADAFSTAGANPLTLTTTATTNVTLPATGTLATLTGTETLTNKTLTDADANTQTAGDNSTKVATTAYVDGAVTSSNSLADGNIFVGSAGGVATAQSLGGDASIINDGTLTVNSVGGSTAANIAAAEAIANAATDANTASAVVRRDASGNFSAGTISADLTGNVTGNVSGTAANVTGIVAGDNGGTGVDNGANTITIGGNVNTADAFSTAGANPLTLTTTATTNVTLPATGTLATLTGTETLTNKTLTDADANTQTAGDNSTKVATTAYVDGAVTSSNSLADGNIFVGSAGGVATAQSLGGDASIINDGTLTVNSVGGSTAANIAAAEAIANAATDANTASAVVRRDASGNFSAGTISADLTGNVTGNVSGTAANVTGIVAGDNGGTGVDNGANTITIGGNVNTADAFSTAGANPLTLTTTATTNVTLPATGTLATLTGTETLTNKTLTDADANTQTAGDNSTKVATTAYVDGAVTSSNSLADGNIFVGSAGGVATAQSLGGDASIINDGTLTVNSVGGSTAANIAAAEAIANAATDANTASAVVRRDASGNFSAGTISADLTGNVTGNVSGTAANVTGIVAGDNGGTGVDNGANTITIGGNVNTADAFSTAGANPLTLTTTATTNVTLPATGTLATLTGTETLTNKTLTDADANTQTAGDNSTKVATTAYVDGAVTSSNSLADGNIFVGSAGGVATAQSLGGDASIINDGTLTVNSVGGSTAANIAAAEAIANAATDANTASAVVRRDASGNFSAGTISADLTGNVTGNVSGTAANVTGIVAGDNGGTGVDNGANTITIGGNVNTADAFSTAGANPLTLTTTATTNVTLPATGTLATLTGTETLTNKSIDADANTISNIENADIKTGAAIDGTKINPDFGAQDVSTTGNVTLTGGTLTLTALGGGGVQALQVDNSGIVQTSDRRLKENIVLLQNTLTKLDQLGGYNYNYKADKEKKKQIGVIAQELEKVYPELVITKEDGFKMVNYQGLIPVLMQAIKEQQIEITQLNQKLADQESKLSKLESDNNEMKSDLDLIKKMLMGEETAKGGSNK